MLLIAHLSVLIFGVWVYAREIPVAPETFLFCIILCIVGQLIDRAMIVYYHRRDAILNKAMQCSQCAYYHAAKHPPVQENPQ
jgi:hypothetical protein